MEAMGLSAQTDFSSRCCSTSQNAIIGLLYFRHYSPGMVFGGPGSELRRHCHSEKPVFVPSRRCHTGIAQVAFIAAGPPPVRSTHTAAYGHYRRKCRAKSIHI